MSKPDIKAETLEYIAEKQLEWLKDRGCTFADMLEDEDGEFIFDTIDHGDQDGTGYEIETRKVYLPDFTQDL